MCLILQIPFGIYFPLKQFVLCSRLLGETSCVKCGHLLQMQISNDVSRYTALFKEDYKEGFAANQ